MGVKFPVLVFGKDDGSARVFQAERDLASWVEPTDVENNEYLAWDREGNPVRLTVKNGGVISHLDRDGVGLSEFIKASKADSPDLTLLKFIFGMTCK